MKPGKTKCEWCLNECDNAESNCPSCGGPIAILEPWILQCGWCNTSNRRDLRSSCSNCNGELPSVPGLGRVEAPPTAPRYIPTKFENRIKYWRNPMFLIGFFFCLFFGWTLIFLVLGIYLIRRSLKESLSRIYALKYGTATKGVIKEAYTDYSQHINNVHPVRIDYVFHTPNEDYENHFISWDQSNLERVEGEHLWIVFRTEDPNDNAIWPPMR